MAALLETETTLLHDIPSYVRQTVIKEIDTLLYGALRHDQAQELDILIQRNDQLAGHPSRGFVYHSMPYLSTSPQYRRVHPLHETLVPDFLAWENHWQELYGREANKVNQYLRRAVACCNYEEELFYVVPESLHPVIKQHVFWDKATALPLTDPNSPFSFACLFKTVQQNYPGTFELMAARRVTNILLGYSEK